MNKQVRFYNMFNSTTQEELRVLFNYNDCTLKVQGSDFNTGKLTRREIIPMVEADAYLNQLEQDGFHIIKTEYRFKPSYVR